MGTTRDETPSAIETDTERGSILVERRELDDGVAEHWRHDDGEHVIRFLPSGRSGPVERHVPGTVEDDPIGWFERSR